jgi:hypothetical protein
MGLLAGTDVGPISEALAAKDREIAELQGLLREASRELAAWGLVASLRNQIAAAFAGSPAPDPAEARYCAFSKEQLELQDQTARRSNARVAAERAERAEAMRLRTMYGREIGSLIAAIKGNGEGK